MGEGKAQKFQDSWPYYCAYMKNKDQWTIHEDRDDNGISCNSASPSTCNSVDDSTISDGSFSSLDTTDDASSSTTYPSSSNSCEALYDLSELMEQLPIKRGLSKFYQGKSESFTCLSRVASIDDLAKKERRPHKRKTKASKGLDAYKSFALPKPIISKKAPRTSFSSSFPGRRESFISSSGPQIPLQGNLGC